MTADGPLVEVVGLSKQYQGLRPLRIRRLTVGRGDRYALAGLDAAAAEVFIHLVTGAMVPDEGDVRVCGQNTRDIATDTEWLSSLDRFGIVTERAVLLDGMTVEANIALPITLAIDPIAEDVRERVAALAREVGLGDDRLRVAAASLAADERVRVHLARALAVGPDVLLLEHPTAKLDPAAAEAIGQTLRRVAETRGLAWIAITEDNRFAQASGGRQFRLKAATGELLDEGGFWKKILSRQKVEGKRQK